MCVCVCVLVTLILTVCDSMDCSPPESSVHGILQARILEWVGISFSRGSPDPGIEPRSAALQVGSLLSEPPGKPHVNGKEAPKGMLENTEYEVFAVFHGVNLVIINCNFCSATMNENY